MRTVLQESLKILLLMVMAFRVAASGPAIAQPAPASPIAPVIEAKALDLLKTTAATLAAAKTLSFTAVNTYERAARDGQPLFYTTLNQVTLQRPDRLRVITPGDGIPDEFYYDGKTMMAYVPSTNLVAVADAPATIDAMIDTAWEKAAIYFPFSDVIASDPYEVMTKDLKSAFYVGQSIVVGRTLTDIIAIASGEVQGELWIGASDHLPRLIRAVYPNEPAHALYQTEYSDWHLGDTVSADAFTSDRASTAHRMPFRLPASPETPKQP
jgi:hypothetical protein